jgi:hypothetical protein
VDAPLMGQILETIHRILNFLRRTNSAKRSQIRQRAIPSSE